MCEKDMSRLDLWETPPADPDDGEDDDAEESTKLK
jgi:hypothetical protein